MGLLQKEAEFGIFWAKTSTFPFHTLVFEENSERFPRGILGRKCNPIKKAWNPPRFILKSHSPKNQRHEISFY